MSLNRELIIDSSPKGVELALLEDKQLVEIHQETGENNFSVGDIFLGRVKKTVSGLNAAFIEVGYEKDAFLHYTDLGNQIRSLMKFTNSAINGSAQTAALDNFVYEAETIKHGKIGEILSGKQPLLVQILKEPISAKGPRLTTEISLPGRYLVLVPFTNVIRISKKIPSYEERKRLERLIESIKPKNFGVIVRTAAVGKSVSDLHEDMQGMYDKWKQVFEKLKGAQPPLKVLSELDKTSGLLRDLLNASFSNIVVNNKAIYNDIKTYISQISPDKEKIVNLFSSSKPIFDHYGITKQIKSSFGKTVNMNSGVYLVIEHTEACHVIDINSGYKVISGDQEANAMAANLEAAKEVARQLRLRDMGGIIVVDFIDLKKPDNKKKLYQTMCDLLKDDRAQHTILPLSKFNLMQLTRERVRPEINIVTAEVCPACGGTGKIESTILLIDQIEYDLEKLIREKKPSKIQLHVHPFIEAYLLKGFMSKRVKWFTKYNKWINIKPNNNYPITEYHFMDEHEEDLLFEEKKAEVKEEVE